MIGLVNREAIRIVKRSSLAVGLVRRNEPKPFVIAGSGFIIDKAGYIVTANHVLDYCKKIKNSYKTQNVETDYAIFRTISKSSGLDIDTAVIADLKKISFTKKNSKFSLNVIDLGFGKMLSPIPDCDPLEISNTHLELYNEVAICGYPSGDFTLDFEGQRMGLRFSPNFQKGLITGYMPFDDAPNPYGIQTDIIGVGGSSGSPLFDPNDGKVVGIAQQVIPATTEVDIKLDSEKILKGYGWAKTGQVYGVTNTVLGDIITAIRRTYNGEEVDELAIHASGLDFTSHIETKVTVDKSKLE